MRLSGSIYNKKEIAINHEKKFPNKNRNSL